MSTEKPTYAQKNRTDQDGWDKEMLDNPGPAVDILYSQGDELPDAWVEPYAMETAHLPMIPLTAPNMPAPGDDFVTLAVSRGDPPMKKIPTGNKISVCSSAGPELTRLHKAALYDLNYWMTVSTKHGKESCKFIPGHLWGAKEATGPRPARVMMIGKWPGYYEGSTCRNFNYKAVKDDSNSNSSKLLMDTLQREFKEGNNPHLPAHGPLGYLNWYVVNAIRFPNPLEKSNDQMDMRWLTMCLPLLQMDLRLVRPDFILCLGTEATIAILGKGKTVSNTFGRVFDLVIPLHTSVTDIAQVHRAKVMTCLHPAATQKHAEQTATMVDGLRNFVNLIQGRGPQPAAAVARQKDRRIIFRGWELEQVIEEAHADPEGYKIAVDCEWHGETPGQPNAYLRTIQFSFKKDQAACVVLHGEMPYPEGSNWLNADDSVIPRRCFAPGHDRCRELLRKLFYERPDGKKVRIIGHNFKADLQWLIPWGLDLRDLFQAPEDDADLDTNPDALPGWAKLATEGGFDTMLAHHAVDEVSDFKLEFICSRLLHVERWDGDIQDFKKAWCAKRKIPVKNLEGYGPFPGLIGPGRGLYYYGMDDVDFGRQLFEEQSKEGGLLDSDRFGQPSWLPFWISMRSTLAFLEMEMNGLAIDRGRVDELTTLYMAVRDQLLEKLRQMINWSSFNHNSAPQCRTLLFGPKFSGMRNKKTGKYLDILKESPKTAKFDEKKVIRFLELTPIVTTGKPPQPWAKALWMNRRDTLPTPATDKQSLSILRIQTAARYGSGSEEETLVETLRRLRFVAQTLKSVLAPPVKGGKKEESGEEYNEYDGGLIDFMQANGRVHTHLYQTKETGRASSSRPPLQNLSSKREADLERTVGDAGMVYDYPLRSVIHFHTDPWGEPVVGCEHDLAGAELLMMAVQSGDEKMIEHCQRNVLPDEGFNQQGDKVPKGKFPHPNYYDIHSSIAVQAFKLTVEDVVDKKSGKKACDVLGLPVGAPLPPTKMALAVIGKSNLRKAAKTVVFGIPYGRGDEAIIRAVEEEGVQITMEDADQIRQAIFGMYPLLEPYLLACQHRATDPGYIVNCFGRRRRFGHSYNKTTQGEAERQSGNFPIQGGVADYVSLALDKFYNYPGRFDVHGRPRYRLGLQIHDAVLAEVRIKDLEWWMEEVVPACMTRIAFYRCDLNGERLSPQPYYMGCGRDIMRSWGVHLEREEGLALGIPEKYLPSE